VQLRQIVSRAFAIYIAYTWQCAVVVQEQCLRCSMHEVLYLLLGCHNRFAATTFSGACHSFAMDRDAQACTRLEVHEVYTLLPSNKAPMGVVEQPDGNYAFGATAAAPGYHPGAQQGYAGMGHGQQGYAQPASGYPAVPRA
jgi:hypothetical protein